MYYIFVVIAAIMISGCQPDPGSDMSEYKYVPDQKLRAERFDTCIKNLPAGPTATKYNDWSEVVDSCESAAYHQSLKLAKLVNGVWIGQDGKPVI